MTDVEVSGDHQMNVAIIIFAKDEEANIGRIIEGIAGQTICERSGIMLRVYVIANGCVDQTALSARAAAAIFLDPKCVKWDIVDWIKPGKSRSWNRAIHEILPNEVQYVIALDADIEFVDENVLSSMLNSMQNTPSLQALSGAPLKNSLKKPRRNLVNRFSTKVSNLSSYSNAICGQLYIARATCLKEIWLPDETPGEDGFLNAMVRTRGFSQPFQADVLLQMTEPTHYYEDHSVRNFFLHEKRMIVGTIINIWIFEYLHSLELAEPAGHLIQRLNSQQPDWVEKIIAERSSGIWLVPAELLFRRLVPNKGFSLRYLLRLPVLIGATLVTLLPAIMANQALKRRGAASFW